MVHAKLFRVQSWGKAGNHICTSIVSQSAQADKGKMWTCRFSGGPEVPLKTFNQIKTIVYYLHTLRLDKFEKKLLVFFVYKF